MGSKRVNLKEKETTGDGTVSIAMVTEALRKVQDPELRRDLVILNMIRDITVEDGVVAFTLVLTTPACPLREQITANARAAVEALPGVAKVVIRLDSSVPTGQKRGQLEITARNSIAVASGKGGVGKSTIAVNLAVSLALSGSHVGLLDADIYGPNIPTMMGLKSLPEPGETRLIPAEAFGVKVMSMGFMVQPGQPLIWRGPMLHSALRQLLTDVEWGDLDYMVIDLPPGTGDVQLSLSQLIPLSGGLIVTLPQQVSLDDARRGLEMFRILEVPLIGVIENMSYWIGPDGKGVDLFGWGGGRRFAEEAGVPFLGEVPIDPNVRIGGDSGKPIVISSPDSEAAKALRQIAEQTAARISQMALERSAR
jgi:ATP-binding protein involved in chromosome partitioning